MRISAVNNFYSPCFTSVQRDVYANDGKTIKHRNNTYFFRNDINWDRLRNYITNKYSNTSKVNTYCYACSDGSEPYSLIMELFTNIGDDAKKFMPIVAKDYDENIIDYAKKGKVAVPLHELILINDRTKGNLNKYFSYAEKMYDPVIYNLKTCGNLYDNIKFETADITKDIHNIEPDNSIIFCRNFWPYLVNDEKIRKLSNDLYKQLGENSMIVLGHFDETERSVYRALYDAGFVLKDEDLRIFEKSPVRRYNRY